MPHFEWLFVTPEVSSHSSLAQLWCLSLMAPDHELRGLDAG
eukprot:CAMPEP_0174369382 /NCGR_PEP_ID=MMETSP0811_2-20130205/92285_1 /TAXON_ID=73025 ORGANISM="Eutreptiella gymnastica-like, Strain CCMP1594" /NCGR_SAMPLE_ID=MMETSP0811_2 /ASSEMBLY_ACC=CAM_ASM_000667 /LENGTH=40 /DNA_ID= /DNA_START= /DNA_END= /DNA_ORIENTATION=